MISYRWLIMLAVFYCIFMVLTIIDDQAFTLHSILMLIIATVAFSLAIWVWVKDEDVSDQQYVESVMRNNRDCLICSKKADFDSLDSFKIVSLCWFHLHEWANRKSWR